MFWARSTGFEGRHTLSSGMVTWLFQLLLLLINYWKGFLHCRHSLSKEGSSTVTIQGRRGRGQSRCSSRSTRRWSPSPGHSQHLGKNGSVSRIGLTSESRNHVPDASTSAAWKLAETELEKIKRSTDEKEDEDVRDEEGTTAVRVSNIREPSVWFDQVRLLMLLVKNDLQTLPKPTLMEMQERRNSIGLSHCSLSGSSPSPFLNKLWYMILTVIDW